jgi:hypothetical protein
VKLAVRHKKKGVVAAQVISSNRSILKKKRLEYKVSPVAMLMNSFHPLEEDRLLPSAHGSLRMNWLGLTL